jgi:hypothetical protein
VLLLLLYRLFPWSGTEHNWIPQNGRRKNFLTMFGIENWYPSRNHSICFFPVGQKPNSGPHHLIFEVSRSHTGRPHSVGLLWTMDRPVAETSNLQETTAIPASERLQTYVLDLLGTRICSRSLYRLTYRNISVLTDSYSQRKNLCLYLRVWAHKNGDAQVTRRSSERECWYGKFEGIQRDYML